MRSSTLFAAPLALLLACNMGSSSDSKAIGSDPGAKAANAAPEGTMRIQGTPQPAAQQAKAAGDSCEPKGAAERANEALAPAAAAAGSPVKLGAPVTASVVSLTDIAKKPATFKGKTIATTGTVTSVCQERGCWMAIKDSDHDAMVRMHGHSFFVPKTSAGRKAKVQGSVVLVKDGKECDDMEAQGSELEFDATGVELM